MVGFLRQLTGGAHRRRVFILGVGAQKAGTTWLHRYFSGRDDADFGFAKEYHVFDAISSEHGQHFVDQVVKDALEQLEAGIGEWRGSDAIRRLSFLNDVEVYFDYFARLLNRDQIVISGDVTPAYASLTKDVLVQIRDGFAKRGVRVCPVFILRDPVDRLHSMVRMYFRSKGRTPTLADELRSIRGAISQPWEIGRGEYPETITNLDTVFGDAVFYHLYEDFFREDALRALCRHLGIRYKPADFSLRANVTRNGNELPEEERREFARRMRDRILFCRDYFGTEKINAAWPSARLLECA